MPGQLPVYSHKFRTVRIRRDGNSIGVTVPVGFRDQLKLRLHDEMRCYVVGEVLCFQRVKGDDFMPGVIGVRPREKSQEVKIDGEGN